MAQAELRQSLVEGVVAAFPGSGAFLHVNKTTTITTTTTKPPRRPGELYVDQGHPDPRRFPLNQTVSEEENVETRKGVLRGEQHLRAKEWGEEEGSRHRGGRVLVRLEPQRPQEGGNPEGEPRPTDSCSSTAASQLENRTAGGVKLSQQEDGVTLRYGDSTSLQTRAGRKRHKSLLLSKLDRL